MKTRLDALMVARKIVTSRSQAENYVRLGRVEIRENPEILNTKIARNFDAKTRAKAAKNEWQTIKKPGFFVREDVEIRLNIEQQFVSRAALKLQSVADILGVDFRTKNVLDIGSSTGGFTQFALSRGAKKVFAVDVGTRQLSPILREDSAAMEKIELHEKTDIRDFWPDDPHAKIDLVLADVSFISLDEILPKIIQNLHQNFAKNCEFILMVKPQFQAKRGSAAKNHGVIKNETERREILKKFELFARKYFVIVAKKDSAVAGAHGNRERFYKMKLVAKS